jgi:hypothetical protein
VSEDKQFLDEMTVLRNVAKLVRVSNAVASVRVFCCQVMDVEHEQ